MSDDRRLDRAARSWLEAGPVKAPDHAVDAALLEIQTTQQERDWHVPWRVRTMSNTARLAVAAIAIALVVVGGALLLKPGGNQTVGAPTIAPSSSAAAAPSASAPTVTPAPVDYSMLHGRILMEHLGNAPDRSEVSSDYHTDRRRFYWMNPATMTGSTAVEFLPGQPPSGKVTADISPNQRKLVFQDTDPSGEHIWLANLDGTGLQKIATTCPGKAACADWDPAFDPTGTKVVFVRGQGHTAVLVIKDLGSGTERVLQSTSGSSDNNVPEQPSWSPDGQKIAFGKIDWNGDAPIKGVVSVVDVLADRTTILPIALNFPGDPYWSRDGSRLLIVDGPLSMAAVALPYAGRTAEAYSIAADGTDLVQITHTVGNVVTANFTPDDHVLFFSNYFYLVGFDGTDQRPVNIHGDDLSELANGFGYVGHWIDTP